MNKEFKKQISCTGEEYLLRQFLEKYSIVVPMLQRDYAQGRNDKAYIRKRLLAEIYNCVKDENNLTLDFVYGYVNEKDTFYPLDGQQRLTTLWLVYWYLAFRSGELSNEEKNLKRFSYETRKSSRDFCEALCTKEINNTGKSKIADCIQNQTWFFTSWKKDPTISAMLRTLGGTKEQKDGIEPVFCELAKKKNKWKKCLQRFKNNIRFYVLEIGNDKMPIEVAERLYVKMNARGKSLSDFENFKADLIEYLKKLNINIEDISRKIDNDWNDIFWKSSNAGNSDGKTDEIFFTFINRFCFNQICLDEKLNANLIKKIDKILEEDAVEDIYSDEQKHILQEYKFLFDENSFSYEEFDYYKDILSKENIEKLQTILTILANDFTVNCVKKTMEEINKIVSKRETTNYQFIPCYKKNNGKKEYKNDKAGNKVGDVEDTTLKGRLYFFTICKYLEINNKFEKNSFNSWMRFCRNIIENFGIDSAGAMISCMGELNKLGTYSNNIIEYLKKPDNSVGNTDTKYIKQLKEEREKAKSQIDIGKIHEAEDYGVFCGHISFLYLNENGEVAWDSFEKKFKKSKEFFNKNEKNDNFEDIKQYAMSFEDFDDVREQQIFHQISWQNRGDNWIDILSDDYSRAHHLLMENLEEKAADKYKEFLNSKTFEIIVKKEDILKGKKDLRVSSYKGKWALYKKSAQDDKLYFDDDTFKRNEIMKECLNKEDFSIDDEHNFKQKENYFWGENIKFTYRQKNYVWQSNDEIHHYKNGRIGDKKIEEASAKSVDEILKLLVAE